MSTIDVKRRPDADAIVDLFELDATNLGASILRFTNCGETVVFGTFIYTSTRVETSGWEMTSQGTLPRPTLRIANVDKLASSLVIGNNDLKGAVLTRKRTFKRFLDSEPEANPSALLYPVDRFRVERKITHNMLEVVWELAAFIDQENIKIPYRQVLRSCSWVYRKYDTTLGAFNYEKATCPYVGAQYYNRNGDVVIDPSADVCGKTVSDCKLRFGENEVLPFGGFPGIARIR